MCSQMETEKIKHQGARYPDIIPRVNKNSLNVFQKKNEYTENKCVGG